MGPNAPIKTPQNLPIFNISRKSLKKERENRERGRKREREREIERF